MVEWRIQHGTVVDPSRGMCQAGEVYVAGERIVADITESATAIDASRCLVFPGLIDYHLHLYAGGTEIGTPPDAGLLPQGVTTGVDAGSAGPANYANFSETVIARSTVRILSLLNVSPAGLVTIRYPENVDPRHYDPDTSARLFERHRGELLGLKVRQGKEIVGEFGLAPLRATLKMSDRLACPVVVHVTNAPCSQAELVDLLRPRDVFCHVYHGTGPTIFAPDGSVLPAIRSARDRGVIFDAANGWSHFVFASARAALQQGFLPDVISTDLTNRTLYKQPVFGLPFVMSKYLSMGMPLLDVVRATTSTPARLIGMEEEIGTLAPGACADIAIFKQVERPVQFVDTQGVRWEGNTLLIPQLTMRAGQVLFRQIDF
ncbi:MAG TPA: metallo-dependent hydrolase [Candidatus Baltobacteraceae bacterium]|nr:metallo-dependent hydrolase [Candidatus Baltobacteraceae bacterium]